MFQHVRFTRCVLVSRADVSGSVESVKGAAADLAADLEAKMPDVPSVGGKKPKRKSFSSMFKPFGKSKPKVGRI